MNRDDIGAVSRRKPAAVREDCGSMDGLHHDRKGPGSACCGGFPSNTVTKGGSDKQKEGLRYEGSKKARRYSLVTFRELPEYMKDNEYILGYYRANWPLSEAFFSLFRWHNETLNVWT